MFSDDTYDLYTIAFGIRNVTSIPDVLREAHRVGPSQAGRYLLPATSFNKITNPLLAQYVFLLPLLFSPLLLGLFLTYG